MTFPITDETVSIIRSSIKAYQEQPDFPKKEEYGIDDEELDDFLFDSRVIEEVTMETEKARLTRLGIIFVIPVAIMAMFTFDTKLRLLIGVAGGIVACSIYLLIEKAIQIHHDKKRASSGAARYCDAVLQYYETHPIDAETAAE
ncbi:MAG: hypothetical protein IKX36_12780 [Prevotella sp.]|nr:hypothetical protein [Prevotella sp.]